MDKKQARRNIFDLETQHCYECEKLRKFRIHDHDNGYLRCQTECKIGKELKQLGDILSPKKKDGRGRPRKEVPVITKKRYQQLIDEGLTIQQIADLHHISKSYAEVIKKKYGLTAKRKRMTQSIIQVK